MGEPLSTFEFDPSVPPCGSIHDWLFYNAKAIPDRPAFLFTDGAPPLTWPDLLSGARKVAMAIGARGIGTGESVAIMMPNSREAVLAFFGTVIGGFRSTLINLVAGDSAIAYALGHSGARLAFVGSGQREAFNRVRPPGLESMVLAEALQAAPKPSPDLLPLDPSDDALLMYTSGTTGRPKGVVHSHASLLAGGWTPTIAHRLSTDDRGYCVLPIYHINGLCVTVMGTVISGATLVMAPRFSLRRFWDDVERHEVTWFSVVPTIISHLLHGETVPPPAVRTRVRFARSASAPLPVETQKAFEARFAVPIIETMGLTEAAAQILSNPLPPGRRKIGSPGFAHGNTARIILADGDPAPVGAEGEIIVSGPNIMSRYLKDPDATQAVFTDDGWLRTGDLGCQDAAGYIVVTGRLKELIIKGGENIAPREIDEVLYAHSDVVEAAAFGMPCQVYGERVEAAVRLRDDSVATAQTIGDHCRARLGAFKAPERIHFLASLPKGPSGKIQRLALKGCLEPKSAATAPAEPDGVHRLEDDTPN